MNYLNEQNNGFVRLDGSASRPPILEAWQGSSSVYWVRPEFPCLRMTFKICDVERKSWEVSVAMSNHPKRGMFRAYIPGTRLSKHIETSYRIECEDEYGSRHVCCEGTFRVRKSAVEHQEDSSIVAYARFTDGIARSVTIAEDDVGAPVFRIGNAVEAPVGSDERIYAYNNATGFFHEVSTFIDDAGHPMLSVSETAAGDGKEQFVMDESGFYKRRIECGEDSAGVIALKTGERT